MRDPIDREDALEAVSSEPLYKTGMKRRYADEAVPAIYEKIKALPPAEPRWIPCNERLPKVRQWVLCQCRAGIMDVLRLTADGSWNKDYPYTDYMSGFVVAWMPLPDAYGVDEE